MGKPKEDLSGKTFNYLTVLEFDKIKLSERNNSQYMWKCKCICGKIVSVLKSNLERGSIKSCGCRKSENISIARKIHGLTKTKEYSSFNKMRHRCLNKNNPRYKDYGERGITVCNEWLNSFETFLEDMGKSPSTKHSLERINNDLGYSKENCRWATNEEQANNKRSNRFITYNNETLTVSQWAHKFNVAPIFIFKKLYKEENEIEILEQLYLKSI